MKKTFLSIEEINNNDIGLYELTKLEYDRLKEASTRTPLTLDVCNLPIGKEYYMVPMSDLIVVPVIIIGYHIMPRMYYDDKTGIAEARVYPIYTDKYGNEYYDNRGYYCVCDTYKEAEKIRLGIAESLFAKDRENKLKTS